MLVFLVFHATLIKFGTGLVKGALGINGGGGGRKRRHDAGPLLSGTGLAFAGKSVADLRQLATTGVAPKTRQLAHEELLARGITAPGGPCFPPFKRDAMGVCRLGPIGAFAGGGPGPNGGGPVGDATMGRFGAALQPFDESRTHLSCPPGMVLGAREANGGYLCYNRRDLRNNDRKWPKGRRPLLTGGDLNAISRAARAATRMKTQQKRLEKLGLLKKPSPRRVPAHPHTTTVRTP